MEKIGFVKKYKKILLICLFLGILFFYVKQNALADLGDNINKNAQEAKEQKTPLSVPIPVDCNILPTSGQLDPSCEKKEIGGLVDIVTTMYRFAVGAGTFLAIIMIVIGGIQYTASEVVGSKEDAKKKIQNAVYGLILLALSIPILNFINPEITLLSENSIVNVATSTNIYRTAYSCGTPDEECRPGIILLDYDTNNVRQCTQECKWKDLSYRFFGIIPKDLSTWEFFRDDAVYERAVGSKRVNLCGTPKSQCNKPSSTLSSYSVIDDNGIKTETKHYCTDHCEDIIEVRKSYIPKPLTPEQEAALKEQLEQGKDLLDLNF